MSKNRKYSSGLLGYIDISLNLMLGFAALFVILLLILKTEDVVTETNMVSPGDIMVKLTWTEGDHSDVDIWVKSEDPELYLSFRNKRNSIMFLDRDDLGNSGDVNVKKNGERVNNLTNSEIVYIKYQGENRYVINLHMYQLGNTTPVDCTVELITTDPNYRVIYSHSMKLSFKGEEQTAFAFTTDSDGRIENVTTDLVERFIYKQDMKN